MELKTPAVAGRPGCASATAGDELGQLYAEFKRLAAEQDRAERIEAAAKDRMQGEEFAIWRGTGSEERFDRAVKNWRAAKEATNQIARAIADNIRRRADALRKAGGRG